MDEQTRKAIQIIMHRLQRLEARHMPPGFGVNEAETPPDSLELFTKPAPTTSKKERSGMLLGWGGSIISGTERVIWRQLVDDEGHYRIPVPYEEGIDFARDVSWGEDWFRGRKVDDVLQAAGLILMDYLKWTYWTSIKGNAKAPPIFARLARDNAERFASDILMAFNRDENWLMVIEEVDRWANHITLAAVDYARC